MGAKFQTAGIGTLDSTLFLGMFPPNPDAMVALIETPGEPPVRTMQNNGVPIVEIQGLQVISRGPQDGYAAARDKLNDVLRLIGSAGAETIGGVRYLSFQAESAVMNIGPDDQNRIQLAMNFLVWKEVHP